MGMDVLSTNAVTTDFSQQVLVQKKHGRLQDAFSVDFGLVQNLTTRAFTNAAHEGVDSGSCWINVALMKTQELALAKIPIAR